MEFLALITLICVLVLLCVYLDEVERGAREAPFNWQRDRALVRLLHEAAWESLQEQEPQADEKVRVVS